MRRRVLRARDLEIEVLHVPPGAFFMGSNDGPSDERPRHVRRIDREFWISTRPVTVEAFLAFERSQGRTIAIGVTRGWLARLFYGSEPATSVTWDEACSFATWIGARLPTEAEWEKAMSLECRARLGSQARFHVGLGGRAVPSGGSAFASPSLLDEAGLEDLGTLDWCACVYDPRAYLAASLEGVAPYSGELRVARGAGSSGRLTSRSAIAPGERRPDLGFRIVVDAEKGRSA